MIIGLDTFAIEEFAHTKWFDIRDWVLVCPPTGPEWTRVEDITGACDKDNITENFGCEIVEATRQETSDAFRVWLNNIPAR